MLLSKMSTFTLNSHGAIPYKNKMFNFYIEQDFVDTELVLADGNIRCHSVVLASECKKLYSMLTVQNETQKTLTLTQFSKETMRVVLEYIYRGIVTYPSLNDKDIMMAISFLELDIKTDECKVESSQGDIDNSVVEIKVEESLLEISDNETEIGTDAIQNKNNEQQRQTEYFTPIPSNVFDQSYDFLSECNRSLQIEDPPSPTKSCSQLQTEKNSPSMNSSPKRKKMKSKLLNPFSQYVNKKSEETQPGTSQQQNNQCTQNTATKTNIWIKKKDNSCKFSKKYCLTCEEKKNHFKAHIRIFHKSVVKDHSYFCEKCSSRFYFKVFRKNHVKTCK